MNFITINYLFGEPNHSSPNLADIANFYDFSELCHKLILNVTTDFEYKHFYVAYYIFP